VLAFGCLKTYMVNQWITQVESPDAAAHRHNLITEPVNCNTKNRLSKGFWRIFLSKINGYFAF